MSNRFSLLFAAALLAGACGGDKPATTASTESIPANDEPVTSQADPNDLVVDGEVQLDVLDARLAAFAELDDDGRNAMLAELDGQMERELWTLSGLEEALGGPQAADAAFAEHSLAIVRRAQEIGGEPIVMSGLRRTAPSGPSIGMGLFGGSVIVSLGSEAIVTSTNDFKDGQKGAKELAKGVNVSASLDHAEMTVDADVQEGGVTTKMHIKVEVNPCPDATGHFDGTAKIDVSATASGGSTGQKGTLDVTVTGQVDDDAKLLSSDADYRMQWADFASGKGSFVDMSGAIGGTKNLSATLTRSGGAPSPTLQQLATFLGPMFAYMAQQKVAEAAQKGWESGRCVALKPTAAPGPTGLDPSSTSTINAAPRSRIDGGPVGGTVTATLSAGEAGVEPSATKVPADATFTYTAAGEVGKSGTVSMEARSKRGVATATINFDTAGAYTASGGTEVTFSGTVADLAAPFRLAGAGDGFDVTFSFAPTGPTSGTLTYTGAGDGFTMTGSGTYTIAGADPDPLTLTYSAEGCVNIGGCRATTSAITLTRDSG